MHGEHTWPYLVKKLLLRFNVVTAASPFAFKAWASANAPLS
jgi:hypothetical protein